VCINAIIIHYVVFLDRNKWDKNKWVKIFPLNMKIDFNFKSMILYIETLCYVYWNGTFTVQRSLHDASIIIAKVNQRLTIDKITIYVCIFPQLVPHFCTKKKSCSVFFYIGILIIFWFIERKLLTVFFSFFFGYKLYTYTFFENHF